MISIICLQQIYFTLRLPPFCSPLSSMALKKPGCNTFLFCLFEAQLERYRKVTQMAFGGSSRAGGKTSCTHFPVWVPGVSSAGSRGLDSLLACRVTLVGCITFLDLSFFIYETKGVLTFSDPLEALGGRNKLMFGKGCVTL